MTINDPEFRLVSLDGRTLRTAIWPARNKARAERPLMFFNGIGANIELIAPFAARLTNRDIVTFDMPGIGGSPDPVMPYRPWMMARIADKLLDELGYGVVDVMGVSWGGGLAQQFAFQHSSRVGKLILAATSAGMVMVPGKLSALTKMADPRRYIDPSFMEKNFRTLYGGSTAGSDGHMARISPPTTKGYLYQLMAMAGWTSVAFLPFVKAETLVMMGDSDHIVPLTNGHILTTLLPNARLEVIEGGGHLFLVSDADRTIAAIEDFLSQPSDGIRKAA